MNWWRLMARYASFWPSTVAPATSAGRPSVNRALNAIDKKILRYLAELDQQDAPTVNVTALTADALTVKLAHLRTRQEHYQSLQHQLEQSGQPQLSLTNSNSRSMPVGQGTAVAFNVQIAVDSKHKLIVAHNVTNAGTDHAQLAPLA